MLNRRFLLGIVLGCNFMLASTNPATGQQAIALLMEIVGEINPRADEYTELVAHANFTLKGNSTVKFFHYSSCKVVTVSGGSIEIGKLDFLVASGGQIKSDMRRRCSESVQLTAPAPGMGAAGMIMRGVVLNLANFSITPSFLLAGPEANRVRKLQILSGERPASSARPTLEMIPQNLRAAWPPNGAALADGSMYTLRLLDSQAKVIGDLKFIPLRILDHQVPEILRIN